MTYKSKLREYDGIEEVAEQLLTHANNELIGDGFEDWYGSLANLITLQDCYGFTDDGIMRSIEHEAWLLLEELDEMLFNER